MLGARADEVGRRPLLAEFVPRPVEHPGAERVEPLAPSARSKMMRRSSPIGGDDDRRRSARRPAPARPSSGRQASPRSSSPIWSIVEPAAREPTSLVAKASCSPSFPACRYRFDSGRSRGVVDGMARQCRAAWLRRGRECVSLTVAIERFPIAGAFTIARGVAHRGRRGHGDDRARAAPSGAANACPMRRYGETVEGVAAAIEALRRAIEGGLDREALAGRHAAGRRPQRARLRAVGPRRQACRRAGAMSRAGLDRLAAGDDRLHDQPRRRPTRWRTPPRRRRTGRS